MFAGTAVSQDPITALFPDVDEDTRAFIQTAVQNFKARARERVYGHLRILHGAGLLIFVGYAHVSHTRRVGSCLSFAEAR